VTGCNYYSSITVNSSSVQEGGGIAAGRSLAVYGTETISEEMEI